MNNLNKKPATQIISTGKASNIVGLQAFIFDGEKLKQRVKVIGRADDEYFIVQCNFNVCKLFTLKQMTEWYFMPNDDWADEFYDEYHNRGYNAYKFDL